MSITLRTASKVPVLGLGTWQSEPGVVGKAVASAIANGYRHVDCAAVYGNEVEVGQSLSSILKDEKSQIKRSDIFVTSKLWNSEHGESDVVNACKETLKNLQLDYLDLYLIHWPQCFEKVEGSFTSFPKNDDGSMKYAYHALLDTWKKMEELVKTGLVKDIGLSNFSSKQIDELMKGCSIKPAMLQVECHPFFQQQPLVDYCHKNDIALTCYSPLGSGASVNGVGVPFHPVLKEIGAKYNKSAAQVAIRFQLQRNLIVIPKSVKEHRIIENFSVSDFQLSKEEMQKISDLDCNKRVGWGGPLINGKPRDGVHPFYPFVMKDDGENDASAF